MYSTYRASTSLAGNSLPNGELTFITTTNDPASTRNRSRKYVRSHAALVGWSARKHKVSKPTPSNPPSTAVANLSLTQQQNLFRAAPTQFRFVYHAAVTPPVPANTPLPGRHDQPRQAGRIQHPRKRVSRASFLETVLNEVYELCRNLGPAYDPLSVFPVAYSPVFAPILDYYHSFSGRIFLHEFVTGWGGMELDETRSWPLRATINMAEPALFYSTLALTSILLPNEHPLSSQNSPLLVTNLTTKTVDMLNVGIADPARTLSHPIILAMLMIVCAESLQGRSANAQRTMLPVIKCMVLARGGLQSIAQESADGLFLARMILWLDRIVARSIDSPPCFQDLEFEEPPTKIPSLEYLMNRLQRRSEVRDQG